MSKGRVAIIIAVLASLAMQGYIAVETHRAATSAQDAAEAASEAAYRLPDRSTNLTAF